MISKYFINETDSDIEITLYTAGREGNLLTTNGARILNITSHSDATVSIEDLRSAFLQGICIKTRSHGESMSLQRGTHEAKGPLFELLNQYDAFRIAQNKASFAIEAVIEEF